MIEPNSTNIIRNKCKQLHLKIDAEYVDQNQELISISGIFHKQQLTVTYNASTGAFNGITSDGIRFHSQTQKYLAEMWFQVLKRFFDSKEKTNHIDKVSR